MKIAVTSGGSDLEAQIDPRFGRARYLLIVDVDSYRCEAIENPNVNATGGAGIQTAQLIADHEAEAVLTGDCGPNASRALAAAGLRVYVGLGGSVREAVESFKRGELTPVVGSSVPDHFEAPDRTE
jgi:predicted Fe-Mo cluster-binding NifX family protein